MAGVLNLLPYKLNNMKKPIIPASFLSAAMPADSTFFTAENHLYLLREKRDQTLNHVSKLYSVLFGKFISKQIQPEESIPSGPDYFSSYE
jgi:hypothetical protein